MITNNRPSLSFADYAADILYQDAEEIITEQAAIRKTYYQRQSGDLDRNLQSRPFFVTKSAASVRLTINYLKTIRFLDMKKTATGGKKRIYVPIYNKVLFGFLYRYTFPRLRFGMSQMIRNHTTGKLQLVIKDPIQINAT